jgi:hypothetical protein
MTPDNRVYARKRNSPIFEQLSDVLERLDDSGSGGKEDRNVGSQVQGIFADPEIVHNTFPSFLVLHKEGIHGERRVFVSRNNGGEESVGLVHESRIHDIEYPKVDGGIGVGNAKVTPRCGRCTSEGSSEQS